MQEKKIKFTDVLFVGLAFFASYFGAGNLIFPPMLGLQSGSNWLSGMIGMLASGVGLPILAIIVLGMCGSVQKISDHVNKKFYTVMIGAIMILCCCVSIPRTAAVGIEMGLQGIWPGAPYLVFVILYFVIAFLFAKDRGTALDKVGKILTPITKLVYGETIANPLMSVPDIQHLADVAHANGAKLFIDNTFATSIIAKPIKYGADLVIYSATKYLGGHDDLVGGAVVGSEEIIKSLSFYLGLYGANLGATESWLLARSLRTLPLRVKKMAENGLALAKFFESHPKVEKVYYPGLESSPSKALADKQFEGNGYGGMLCVNFKGGQKEIDKLISNLQLVRFVPTLAGVGTTLTYPPRASHRDLSPDELAAIGITMGQIRLSSGLEDTDDLLNDFDQALAKM